MLPGKALIPHVAWKQQVENKAPAWHGVIDQQNSDAHDEQRAVPLLIIPNLVFSDQCSPC
jgi:hypothetical protein